MFFGKKQTGFMTQPPAINMVQPGIVDGMQAPGMMDGMHTPGMMDGMQTAGMPYEGFGAEQVGPDGVYSVTQTETGYACDPCGYCEPYYEHTEIEVEKPLPQVYVVKKGDTVYKIAKRYGLDWRELAGYNHLGNPNLIYPGERLFIPPRY
ncbi:MAG: LysM peptidoglycan-binding domain-containing protein [Peptococcaceae bacterium]|nr:LysM peptidoglycan-binding domain-containing protein [Peptococcaceae bacterium]